MVCVIEIHIFVTEHCGADHALMDEKLFSLLSINHCWCGLRSRCGGASAGVCIDEPTIHINGDESSGWIKFWGCSHGVVEGFIRIREEGVGMFVRQFEVESFCEFVNFRNGLSESLLDSDLDQVNVFGNKLLPELVTHCQGEILNRKSSSFAQLPVDLIVRCGRELNLEGKILDGESIK